MRRLHHARARAAFEANKARGKADLTPAYDPLPRIDALTRNARNTWFALLSALFFFGLTLLGVRHIDFFDASRTIDLPFVDVPVPSLLFFLFAPALTSAVYCYFHLYLLRLWQALGDAQAEVDGEPLGRKASPWLVTDAAIMVRQWLRPEEPAAYFGPVGKVEFAAALLNLGLSWGFGILVLALASLIVLPIGLLPLSIATVVPLLVACSFGAASLTGLFLSMGNQASAKKAHRLAFSGVLLFTAAALTIVSISGAQSLSNTPAALSFSLDFAGAQIVERPENWRNYQTAKNQFRDQWCAREQVADCANLEPETTDLFESEWLLVRSRELAELPPPILPAGLDLTGANLEQVFWPLASLREARMKGAILRAAQMEGADLSGAQMEGADFSFAQLERANLIFAQMEGADLSGAQMEGANLHTARMSGAALRGARMDGAGLTDAQLEGADLSGAQMEGANLSVAQMEGAILSRARMAGADLSFVQMAGADLREARMAGAVLRGARMAGAVLDGARMERADLSEAQLVEAFLVEAQMEGANLSYSLLTGTADRPTDMTFTNLSASTNNGGALRFADLSGAVFDAATVASWQNSFGDATVVLPKGWPRPCQWADDLLDDAAFYGRWRGWIEVGPERSLWISIAPRGFEEVPAIPPPPGCRWTTEAEPAAEAE